MNQNQLPKVVTFDGEARSGKGTIVQATKDFLRDEQKYNVMLIDRGQTFRVLVVAATNAGIDLDNDAELDAFLSDEDTIEACTLFVKQVYHMDKQEREQLLYTNVVGENSAKVGARPASQSFVASLTKKWLADARNEGYEVVLIDGRSLENIASEMHHEGLCDYKIGLYFVCNAVIGARRTLKMADRPYEALSNEEQTDVDTLVQQIKERNRRDFDREVERLAPPDDAPTWALGAEPPVLEQAARPMVIVDTSAELSKDAMSRPVAMLVAKYL